MPAFACTASASGLLLIDVQERFVAAVPSIAPDQAVGRTLRLLLTAAHLHGVPTLISEQYPAGLGRTLPHLVEAAPTAPRMAKMHFSCVGDPELREAIAVRARHTWVLCGIETHVCVLQTAADLLSLGHEVVVASDAVDSRKPEHREAALATLRTLGALVLPGEAIAMRWTMVAGTPLFKQISALIK
jgi:nicotinamidase-related amidase